MFLLPKIPRTISKLPNVYVDCTKSGRLDKAKFKKFVEVVLIKNVKKKCLLVDPRPGHEDKSMYEIPEKGIRIVVRPEGSTFLIQPLDVRFFHYWKDFLERLTKMITLQQSSVDSSQRETVVNFDEIIRN